MPDILTPTGLELESPSPGDLVTVRVRPPRHYKPGMPPPSHLMLGHPEYWEFENPQHYRHTAIWRVVSINAGHAVVEVHRPRFDHQKGREVWPIAAHQWFDASELAAALDDDDA